MFLKNLPSGHGERIRGFPPNVARRIIRRRGLPSYARPCFHALCRLSTTNLSPEEIKAGASLIKLYTAGRSRKRRRATAVLAHGWDARGTKSSRGHNALVVAIQELNSIAGKDRRYSPRANRTLCPHDFLSLKPLVTALFSRCSQLRHRQNSESRPFVFNNFSASFLMSALRFPWA